jgi:DNA-binding NtrC family response regulator
MHSILIASEDQGWLSNTAAQIRQAGFNVESANGGVDCVRKLRSAAPFALIVDVDLRWGGVDGVLNVLDEEFAERPIVVIIGNSPSMPARTNMQRTDYLPKQVEPSAMMAAVLRLASKPLALSSF